MYSNSTMYDENNQYVPIAQGPGETQSHYRAFKMFLAQELPRHISITAVQLGYTYNYIAQISSKNSWKDRAREYDAIIAKSQMTGAQKAAEDMAGAHLRALAKIRFLCEHNINILVKRCQETLENESTVAVKDITAMLKMAIHYERLIASDAFGQVEKDTPDLELLTDEELEQLANIEGKLYGTK